MAKKARIANRGSERRKARDTRRKMRRKVYISYNFSDIEDSPDAFKIIKELGSNAGKSAAAEAKAAKLPRIFARDNQIIMIDPNGHEQVVTTNSPKGNKFYISYKPGTKLHATK